MSNDQTSLLRPVAINPATTPELTPALQNSVKQKRLIVLNLLKAAIAEFGNLSEITFANSMGAEDMVLTDIIQREALSIEIFSLDTGRLPTETYDLIAATEQTYQTKLKLFFPQAEPVQQYVRTHGINAFYESIDLRKACCFMRKVEPLQRALKGK